MTMPAVALTTPKPEIVEVSLRKFWYMTTKHAPNGEMGWRLESAELFGYKNRGFLSDFIARQAPVFDQEIMDIEAVDTETVKRNVFRIARTANLVAKNSLRAKANIVRFGSESETSNLISFIGGYSVSHTKTPTKNVVLTYQGRTALTIDKDIQCYADGAILTRNDNDGIWHAYHPEWYKLAARIRTN